MTMTFTMNILWKVEERKIGLIKIFNSSATEKKKKEMKHKFKIFIIQK